VNRYHRKGADVAGTNVLATPLCNQLGIQLPIVQAPIGSAATPGLAAAVAEAGGLGMLALTWVTPQEAADRIRQVRQLTDRPVGVNLVLEFPIGDLLAACLAEGAPIVSSFWGDPAPVTGPIHAAGALHLHTVGTAEEARRAVDAGVDVVVAQGWEAGGHVWGQVTTMALVPEVVDAVAPVPVIAAGGIGDGRGLAAVLALGAQAGWLGTRFLTATEAATHQVYRHQVLDAGPQDTVYTRCFDGGWPDAPHRAIRNTTITAWEAAGSPSAPSRPGEGAVVATDRHGRPQRRYGDMIPLPGMTGELEAMALYAGQSVGVVHEVAPAAQIVATIATQAARILAGGNNQQLRH
jgi:NAD(P)H-dependent flavin oxidoreductase YrpB (nitropropane dioxygenase family)